MIVVVANLWDHAAKAFASRWQSHGVRVLTCGDLSVAGWRQTLTAGHASTVVVDGALVPQEQITGVLTRLSGIAEEEISGIAREDREYAAAEMTAFLWFWLSSLTCPMLNRPTVACLSGPYWRQESWVHAAAQAGIPVEPAHRRTGSRVPEEHGSFSTVTVVGERVFGETDPVLQNHARRLAALAGVDLLAVRFSNPEAHARLISADVFPDLTDDCVGAAILDYLGR